MGEAAQHFETNRFRECLGKKHVERDFFQLCETSDSLLELARIYKVSKFRKRRSLHGRGERVLKFELEYFTNKILKSRIPDKDRPRCGSTPIHKEPWIYDYDDEDQEGQD